MRMLAVFFFSSRRRHTRLQGDWSSDVCSSDLNDDAIRAVSLIPAAVSEVISEARHHMPLREPAEEGEGVTYSTETGVEAEAEGDKKKKPARRKRRPKPEAIAARLKTDEAPAPAPAESSGAAEGER